MARRAPDQSMLPRVPGLLQNLEDRNRRWKSLHGVAGRADDLTDIGARRDLHDLEGRRQRAESEGSRLRHWRSAQRAPPARSAAANRNSAPRFEATHSLSPYLASAR